jgi:hypothetical protein
MMITRYVVLAIISHLVATPLDSSELKSILLTRQDQIEKIATLKVSYRVDTSERGRSWRVYHTFLKSGEMYRILSRSPDGSNEWLLSDREASGLSFDSNGRPHTGQIEKIAFPQSSKFYLLSASFAEKSADGKRILPLTSCFTEKELADAEILKIDPRVFNAKLSRLNHYFYDIQLDCQYDHRIISIQTTMPKLNGRTTKQFLAYKKIKGIQLPVDILIEHDLDGVKYRTERITVESIQVNDPNIAAETKLVFPENLTIHDAIEKVTFEQGKNGQRLNVRPYEMMSAQPGHEAKGKPPTTLELNPPAETPAYSTFSWLLPVSFVAFLFAIAILVWR